MIRPSLKLAAGVVVLAAVSSSPGRAATFGDQTRPDALIEQGLALRRQGKPAEALELFQRAHAIAPTPRTYGQMGLAEASLRRYVDADVHLEVSLANPDDPWVIKNRAFLEQALAACKQHIGELVVSGPAGVEVFVAGNSAGTLPAVPALRLPEGRVSVTASGSGYKPFETTVTIRPGKRTPLSVAMVRDESDASATPPVPSLTGNEPSASAPQPLVASGSAPAEAPSTWHRWTGGTLALLGAAAIAWGAVWVAVDGKCKDLGSNGCVDEYTTKTGGWIFIGAGAASLVTGAILFFTQPSDASPSVALGVSPGSMFLEGRF
jgi:tetratricopeptide repeat protein/PEGA domain-containing protein